MYTAAAAAAATTTTTTTVVHKQPFLPHSKFITMASKIRTAAKFYNY
jgi:hypothetical protein